MRTCPKCGSEYADDVDYCKNDGTRMTSLDTVGDANQDPRIGSILGSYRIVQKLGEGGMGAVYLAEHTRLGRRVALKLLHPEYAKDATSVKRFFGEARAVNQIQHEHIVEITDFIEQEDNYYIMELLQGVDLAEVQKREGSVPLERTLHVMSQVTSALAAVHDAGIVHRDLKPENIFLIDRAGQKDFVKLLDFGVAKLMDQDGEQLAKTKTGAILGTPMYMSSEQLTGKPVDYRTDIYAIGVILYELVTGRRPYNIRTVGELVIKQMTETPLEPHKVRDLPHKVPKELEQLIMECLSTAPEQRPQTMVEVRDRLTAMYEGEPVPAARSRPKRPSTRSRGRGGLFAGAAIAIIVIGVGSYAAYDRFIVNAPTPTPVAAATPANINVTFESTPAGAEIYRAGESAALGITPMTAPFGRMDAWESFTFRLPNHAALTKKISMNEDITLRVELKKERKPVVVKRKKKKKKKPIAASTPTPVKKKKKKFDTGGTIDPFADD